MSGTKERASARAADRAGAKRYGMALLLLVLAIIATSFVDQGAWAKVLVLIFEGGALLFLVETAEAGRGVLWVARVVVGLGVLGVAMAAIFGNDDAGKNALAGVGILMAVVAPVVVVRDLRREREVNLQVAMGVLVVYLLIGMFFVFVYQLVQFFDPPFFVQVSAPKPDPVDFTYFSYVTLATIGYGDLTARSDLGRMLAVSEGLIGQLYLVSVVALVISGLGRTGRLRRGLEAGPDDAGSSDDDDVSRPRG